MTVIFSSSNPCYHSLVNAHTFLTVDLRLQPIECTAIELLVWRSVGEAVRYCNIGEEFQYATLHGQFIKISIQKRENALGQVHIALAHSACSGVVFRLQTEAQSEALSSAVVAAGARWRGLRWGRHATLSVRQLWARNQVP